MNTDFLMFLWFIFSTFVIYMLFRRPVKAKERIKTMGKKEKQLFLFILSFIFTSSMVGMIEFFDIILRLIF